MGKPGGGGGGPTCAKTDSTFSANSTNITKTTNVDLVYFIGAFNFITG